MIRVLHPALAVAVLLALGCASKRPVLYPNATYHEMGEARAEEAVESCMAAADAYGAGGNRSAEVARQTAESSAAGGAAGAAVGAIASGTSAGTGAAAGAASAGIWALMRGLFRSDEPDAIYKRFVDQCLRDRGYQSIGWK